MRCDNPKARKCFDNPRARKCFVSQEILFQSDLAFASTMKLTLNKNSHLPEVWPSIMGKYKLLYRTSLLSRLCRACFKREGTFFILSFMLSKAGTLNKCLRRKKRKVTFCRKLLNCSFLELDFRF